MRILVIRPGALGDLLLTLPALEALRAGFRHSTIEVMGNPRLLQLLLDRSPVAAVSSFDREDLAGLFVADATPSHALQRHFDSFDVIVSYAAPPEHVFAHNLARMARGRVLNVDPRPRPDLKQHMSEYLQQPLAQLGIVPYAGAPRLVLTRADKCDASALCDEHDLSGRTVVAIHPGSGSKAKNWPAARFAQVAVCLRTRLGAQVVLVCGPADAHAVSEVSRNLMPTETVLLSSAPLSLLAGILARCDGYLGNDSGVSHLAAAVGAPVVAIFGPTDAELWAPRGPKVRILRGAVACSPCTAGVRNECAERACLVDVSVQDVLEAMGATSY